MTWQLWRQWIAVGAVVPVFLAITIMALDKQFLDSDPWAALIRFATLIVLISAFTLYVALPWIVLRKLAPRLGLGKWILCLIGMLMIFSMLYQPDTYFSFFIQLKRAFNSASYQVAFDRPVQWFEVLMLPWHKLLLPTAIQTGLLWLPAAIVLGLTAKRMSRVWAFWLAIILGSCAAAVSTELYQVSHVYNFLSIGQMNGEPWSDRIDAMVLHAVSGAIGAAFSGLGLAYMFSAVEKQVSARRFNISILKPVGIAVCCIFTVAVWFAGEFFVYLNGPMGLRVGAPSLVKRFTAAPAVDRSEYEPILSLSHQAAAMTHHWPDESYARVGFAPDGKTFLLFIQDRQLARIDIQTGEVVGLIAEPFHHYDRQTYLWTSDGKYFVLKNNGKEVAIPNTRFTSHQTRLRVYALPDYTLISDTAASGDWCFNTTSEVAEDPGGGLWIKCSQYAKPQAGDLMAIKYELPGLRIAERRRYEESAESGEMQTFRQVNDDVWVVQRKIDQKLEIRLSSLNNRFQPLVFQGFENNEMAGGLTYQGVSFEQNRLKIRFCGSASKVSNPPDELTEAPWGPSFCRTVIYDVATGKYLGLSDRPETRNSMRPGSTQVHQVEYGDMVIEGRWATNSKAGYLIVRDRESGKIRQRIETVAQRPIAISPNGKWLISHAFDVRKLRIYAIAELQGEKLLRDPGDRIPDR